MRLSWIDEYVTGVIENYNSNDVYDIYNSLDIHIIKVGKNDNVLKENDAVYIRSFYGIEVVYLRDDLPSQYEKFVLSHELGHAILHTEIASAAYSNKLIVKGKLEKQATYFALKLLDLYIDPIDFEGLNMEQISRALHVPEDCLVLV